MKYFIYSIVTFLFILSAGFAYYTHKTTVLDFNTTFEFENTPQHIIYFSEPVLNI
jgi:hypothetical protein